MWIGATGKKPARATTFSISRIWGNSGATIRIGKLRAGWTRSLKKLSPRNARNWRRLMRNEPEQARMKAPFFTVLIDTYNYRAYLVQAVPSARAQNFPAEAREILVVHHALSDQP